VATAGGTATATLTVSTGASSPRPPVAADTLELWRQLGPWTDADPQTGFTLLRWCDAVGAELQVVDDLIRDEPSSPGWSKILDPARAPRFALPWLGQLVGVQVDPTMPDAAQRSQITTEAGFARGTPAALVAIAQRYLTGAKTVTLTERDGNPYTLSIALYTQQLGSSTYVQSQTTYATYAAAAAGQATYAVAQGPIGEVVVALRAAKPAGLVLNINVLSGLSYAQMTAAQPTYTAESAAYPTYSVATQAAPA
jgi:hypothetical protein